MPRIITALYEDRGAAERALQALIETGTARDRIAIIGEKHATGTEVAPSRPPAPDENVTAALRGLALPGEDTRLFEAGLRRGCALVSVRVDGGDVDRAIQTLEMFDPVDLDRRSQEWLRGGAGATASARSGVDVGEPLGAGLTAGSGQGDTNLESVPGMGTMGTTPRGSARRICGHRRWACPTRGAVRSRPAVAGPRNAPARPASMNLRRASKTPTPTFTGAR